MTKRIGRMTIFVGLLLMLSTSTITQDHIPIYMQKANIFAGCFTEPIESVIFIVRNGNFYMFTNQLDSAVYLEIDEFELILNKDDLKISDIIYVIHNHLSPPFRFSSADKKFFYRLKMKGFKGIFALWASPMQRVVDYLPREENK